MHWDLNQGIWVPTVPLSSCLMDCVQRHLEHLTILRTQYGAGHKVHPQKGLWKHFR